MSSLYVRQKVREWAAAASVGEGLPFYDTVNREQDPGDAMWSTAEFTQALNQASTFCADEETGTVDLLFMARGGGGDEVLLTAAEAAVAAFMANTDTKLTLDRNGPPEDFPAGGGVPWFVVLFPIAYTYQPTKGA